MWLSKRKRQRVLVREDTIRACGAKASSGARVWPSRVREKHRLGEEASREAAEEKKRHGDVALRKETPSKKRSGEQSSCTPVASKRAPIKHEMHRACIMYISTPTPRAAPHARRVAQHNTQKKLTNKHLSG